MGISIYLPFNSSNRVDLIAEFNNKLNKIQIKTSEKAKDGTIIFKTCSEQSTRTKGEYKYLESDIDYFAFYNIEKDICLLMSFKDCTARRAIQFRYEKPKNNQVKGINFIEDYSFEKILLK